MNALLAAETTTGKDGRTLFAMPVDRVLDLLRRPVVCGTEGSGLVEPERIERRRVERRRLARHLRGHQLRRAAPRITPSDP